MSAQLVPLSATGAPPIPLSRPILVIGRTVDCDVRIPLPQVSRRHCCLALVDDVPVIRDLGSKHGIRHNGRQVDEARLKPGDEIAIAQVIYRLVPEFQAAPQPSPLAAPKEAPSPSPTAPAKAPSPSPGEPEPMLEALVDDDDDEIVLIPLDD